MTRDLTLGDLARIDADTIEAIGSLQMDEDAFRLFYERTARPVWAYLSRATGSARLADDLLQETYYRFLRASGRFEDEAHQRNYLFRIAANLVQDARRRRRTDALSAAEDEGACPVASSQDAAVDAQQRVDLGRAMARLTARDRDLLWLAYANGCSHREIARSLGLRTSSVKMLLFRARRRLAALLGGGPGR
ncbi:MAG TPA: sigma-70 family RNA polymerase sigma factor [Vicinamibacterales bacterium]|nr:sigma-70 family RNA polymerase sigma factor [Vicinamibacterales bacterium]